MSWCLHVFGEGPELCVLEDRYIAVMPSPFLGDFRYIPDLIDHSVLKDYTKDSKNAIDCIYLDNTYSEEKYDFPSQVRLL